MLKILLVVLGCNVPSLLFDRLDTAIDYALQQDNTTRIDWLLTGGIKNPDESTVSEARKMARMVVVQNNSMWNIVLDEESKNTAENFVMVNRWTQTFHYDETIIVTSAFHQPRCEVMVQHILNETKNNLKEEGRNNANKQEYSWLLSPLELPDSRYWESIHIKNAKKDALQALKTGERSDMIIQTVEEM